MRVVMEDELPFELEELERILESVAPPSKLRGVGMVRGAVEGEAMAAAGGSLKVPPSLTTVSTAAEPRPPLPSDTVRVAVYEPRSQYSWRGSGSVEIAPSPKSHE